MVYWKTALIMSYFFIFQVIIYISGWHNFYIFHFLYQHIDLNRIEVLGLPRFCSLCGEPSYLGYFLAPAFSFVVMRIIKPDFIDKEFSNIKSNWQCFCVFFAYMMSFSLVAYIGIVLLLLIILFKSVLNKKIIFYFVVFLSSVIFSYIFINNFRERIVDFIKLISLDYIDYYANLSSFTFYQSLHVSIESIKYSYGFGTGLSSYKNMFDIFNIGGWGTEGLQLNTEDGNSLFLRMMTEMGCFMTFLLIFTFFYVFYSIEKEYIGYSSSLLVLFLIILLRMGNYTHGALILFVCIYLQINHEYKDKYNVI